MRKIFLYIIIIACASIANPLLAVSITEEPATQASSVSEAPAVKASASIAPKSNETLSYNIYFHMGFIWAKAGFGKLNFTKEKTQNGEFQYHGQLAAKSLSIVEHIMKVRDTLDCWFNADMVPTRFRKGTHEGNYNAIAVNTYSTSWKNINAAHTLQNVDSTNVTIDRWRKKGNDPKTINKEKFSNKGVAYDMLSVFYSVRHLDYAKMKKGNKLRFTCYDGLKCQTINVEYRGKESCELRNEKKYDAYLIYLTFDTKGQKNTPLQVWLSTTDDHHPIKAVIALSRIGSVQCEINE